MSVPAWLIPALRAALRVAVRVLRRYDDAQPFDPSQRLVGTVVFTPQDLERCADTAQFSDLLKAKTDNLTVSLAIAWAARRPRVYAPPRKLTEIDVP